VTRWRLLAPLLAAALALLGAAPAWAGLFSEMHYGVTGGVQVPFSRQGRDLKRGSDFGAEIYKDTNLGVQLGIDGSYTTSDDPLQTRLTHVGGIMRLSPSPEDYRLYVQLGIAGYYVDFTASAPPTPKPESELRPGGSFAVGFKAAEWGNVSLGASGVFHGVVLQRHHALTYLAFLLHLDYQRLAF